MGVRRAFVLLTWMGLATLLACRRNLPLQANGSAVVTSEPAILATTTTSVPALRLEVLKNAEYHSAMKETFQLVDGIYYLTPLPGESRNDWYIKLDQPIAFGDVNGDGADDAVVTLTSRGGGTGVWHCLAVVVNHGGQPWNVATQCLGDRDRIAAIRITDDGVIIADVVIHGPGDGACCPSVETTWRYRLVGTELVKSEG